MYNTNCDDAFKTSAIIFAPSKLERDNHNFCIIDGGVRGTYLSKGDVIVIDVDD